MSVLTMFHLSDDHDQDGFPLIPSSVSWDKVSKEDLEAMYWSYITQHYHKCQSLIPFQWDWFRVGLACGGKDRQTPFQQISLKQSDFILSKYLPLDTTLDCPWMMCCETMVKVFKHIAAHQASHGIQDALAVLSSCKKGSLRPACYFDSNVEQVSLALEVTNTNSQCKKGGTHWNTHKVAEQMLQTTPYSFTTIPSQPNVQRGLAKDPVSLEGPTANQCLELIPASTYPLSSVSVGPAHIFLAQALTLFYDPAFTVRQTVQLDPKLDPDIHWGLGMGFEFNIALSRTFSTIIDPNGALPNTILATDNHLAPGPDGLQTVPQISPTHTVTEICDRVGPRPPAGQTEVTGPFQWSIRPQQRSITRWSGTGIWSKPGTSGDAGSGTAHSWSSGTGNRTGSGTGIKFRLLCATRSPGNKHKYPRKKGQFKIGTVKDTSTGSNPRTTTHPSKNEQFCITIKDCVPHPLTPAPISDGPGPCQVVIERRISQRLVKALAVGRAARPETVATAKQLVPPPKLIKPHQKGQNAWQLAIEEAKRYGGVVGKHWRQLWCQWWVWLISVPVNHQSKQFHLIATSVPHSTVNQKPPEMSPDALHSIKDQFCLKFMINHISFTSIPPIPISSTQQHLPILLLPLFPKLWILATVFPLFSLHLCCKKNQGLFYIFACLIYLWFLSIPFTLQPPSPL